MSTESSDANAIEGNALLKPITITDRIVHRLFGGHNSHPGNHLVYSFFVPSKNLLTESFIPEDLIPDNESPSGDGE